MYIKFFNPTIWYGYEVDNHCHNVDDNGNKDMTYAFASSHKLTFIHTQRRAHICYL